MLECLRQVVQREMRDRERRANPTPHQGVDKSDPQYAERLRQAKLATEAVRQGCATGEQQRAVSLKHRTEREYRNVDAYVRVNTAIDPKMFIPDLYKTGWRGAQHRADVKAERTVAKVEARRITAVA